MMAKTVHMKNLPVLSPSLRIFLDMVKEFPTKMITSSTHERFSIERYSKEREQTIRLPNTELSDALFCVETIPTDVSIGLYLLRVNADINAQTTIKILLDEGFLCVGFQGLAHIIDHDLNQWHFEKWILAPHCKLEGVHDVFHHPAKGIPYFSKAVGYPSSTRKYVGRLSYSSQALDTIPKDRYLLFGKIAP
jgi:hypothetical protein